MLSSLPQEVFHFYILPNLCSEEKILFGIAVKGYDELSNDEESCIMKYATDIGGLELLKWVRMRGCPWAKDSCLEMAANGHLNLLKYAKADECPWDSSLSIFAAGGGYIAILEWLSANGEMFNHLTCTTASMNGQLEVLF